MESNDVNRLLKVKSTQPKFDKDDIEEKSTMNPHQVKWIDKLDTYSFHIITYGQIFNSSLLTKYPWKVALCLQQYT